MSCCVRRLDDAVREPLGRREGRIEKNWIALGDAEQEAYLAAASEVSLQGAEAPLSKVEPADEGEPVTSSLDSDEDPEF